MTRMVGDYEYNNNNDINMFQHQGARTVVFCIVAFSFLVAYIEEITMFTVLVMFGILLHSKGKDSMMMTTTMPPTTTTMPTTALAASGRGHGHGHGCGFVASEVAVDLYLPLPPSILP